MIDGLAYPVTLRDLEGFMALKPVQVHDKEEREALINAYIPTYNVVVNRWDQSPRVQVSNRIDKLWRFDTSEGLFYFVINGWNSPQLDWHHGVWFPEAVPMDMQGAAVGEIRVMHLERTHPMLVMVSDSTNSVVLEFGTLTREDDDPNMRKHSEVHVRWEPEVGFESRFLPLSIEENEFANAVIVHGKPRCGPNGATPKRTTNWRGSRKNNWR